MAMNQVNPDWKAIRGQNKANLDRTVDGDFTRYLLAGNILLVGSGPGHASVQTFCVNAPGAFMGTIRVDKATHGGVINRGTLTVSSKGKGEREIAAELRQISNKNIVFVLDK